MIEASIAERLVEPLSMPASITMASLPLQDAQSRTQSMADAANWGLVMNMDEPW